MALKNLYFLRDWLFSRLVWFLIDGTWKVEIKDFKGSQKKSERCLLGLMDPDTNTIFLDKHGGTPAILVHELGHIIFQDILDEEVRGKPKKFLKNIKGRRKFEKWSELRVKEWERYFTRSLSRGQVRVLQFFIDEAKKRKRR